MNSKLYLIVKKETETNPNATNKNNNKKYPKLRERKHCQPKPYCVTACFSRLFCAMVFNFPPTFCQFEQLQPSKVSDVRNHWLLRCRCGCGAALYQSALCYRSDTRSSPVVFCFTAPLCPHKFPQVSPRATSHIINNLTERSPRFLLLIFWLKDKYILFI